ncbi:MAG: FAD-dependent oxidoreductase [Planctomycetes bacterium]|nr:FAD-dependent oxidoreductase [Planctomycetota bacterium]
MVRLTIDGKQVEVEKGSTLLEAAESAGISIPTLCHHKSLTPYGACRVCVVEVEDSRGTKIQASCVYPASDGLVVKTDSERVRRCRKVMVEFLLARCPDSPAIQRLAGKLGIEEPRFRKKNEDCILCGLCVRVCQERMGPGAVNFILRGPDKKVATAYDRSSIRCMACGACAQVCPVDCVDLSKIAARPPRPIPSEFEMGMGSRKAIYIPYAQAVPRAAVIDPATCMHFLKGTCKSCENFCDADAIQYDQQDSEENIEVGAVILAPGYDMFDPRQVQEYGYGRYPNVLSSIQFERVLSASGPTEGHIRRPSDHKAPKKIAFIQCIGSREAGERDYCSSVCCMYATKHAIIGMEHEKGLKCTVFYIDMRAFGKGFDNYFERAKEQGVRYIRCKPSAIREDHQSHNLLLTYQDESLELATEEFDMVVLSCGLTPCSGVADLAGKFGVRLNEYGFCQTDTFSPVETSTPGVYVCGPFAEPKDIPETVMQSSGAASKAMGLLAEARGTLLTRKEYPPEKDVRGQEARIGVFVCHCGKNIGGVADVPSVAEYARTLENVVYAEDNLYTCSVDTQERIKQMIREHDLNRVVVSSCTPRTHEPLFRDTCRMAGLNEYLFEMANIRDHNTWVHMNEPSMATDKAKELTRMAVARARLLEPLKRRKLPVCQDALIIGGGLAGMTAALELGNQGFLVHLVEKESELGGNLRHIHYLFNGADPQSHLQKTIEQVRQHPKIHLHLDSRVIKVDGFYGNFESTIATESTEETVLHGAIIVATGAEERRPTEYLYGEWDRVLTQTELEERIVAGAFAARNVVMIQCVGSREPERPWCSRVCCSQAIKNALKIKELSPDTGVFVLYRDIRTYGFREQYYTEARRRGVRFIRYDPERKPVVEKNGDRLRVQVHDPMLNQELRLDADILALSTGIVPRSDSDDISKMLKISLGQENFFLEAHMKLRPIDCATDGIFVAGLCHWPKAVDESIIQAGGAASRAATILAQKEMELGGSISEVIDANCDGCAYCIDPCSFHSITLIEYALNGTVKKTVEVNESLCKGCGTCQATCPKGGIEIRHFRPRQIETMVDAILQPS